MFEHVVNSVYIPLYDVISQSLDVFGWLLSVQFYDIDSKVWRRLNKTGSNFLKCKH